MPEATVKVLILGLMKSGTTALAYRLFTGLQKPKKLYFEPGRAQGAEDRRLHERICRRRISVVTKNLIYPTRKTDWTAIMDNAGLYSHPIWLARDPRDILISTYFYHWYRGHGADDNRFDVALERTLQKESSPGSVSFLSMMTGTVSPDRDQLAMWQGSWYQHLVNLASSLKGKLFCFRYEDMIDGRVKSLEEFVGYSLDSSSDVPKQHQRVVRTRGYGNWRRWFTEEDVIFFKPLFEEYMKAMGYDASDWALDESPRLKPAEGSEYMARLHAEKPVLSIASRIGNRIRGWM